MQIRTTDIDDRNALVEDWLRSGATHLIIIDNSDGMIAYMSDPVEVWICPECSWANLCAGELFEICNNCGSDHTLDWDNYLWSVREKVTMPNDD